MGSKYNNRFRYDDFDESEMENIRIWSFLGLSLDTREWSALATAMFMFLLVLWTHMPPEPLWFLIKSALMGSVFLGLATIIMTVIEVVEDMIVIGLLLVMFCLTPIFAGYSISSSREHQVFLDLERSVYASGVKMVETKFTDQMRNMFIGGAVDGSVFTSSVRSKVESYGNFTLGFACVRNDGEFGRAYPIKMVGDEVFFLEISDMRDDSLCKRLAG